ncbi:hypothetical protein BDQ12DRAFT_680895 [Crucibulum laeve]|uniref:Store-operated calcium entry-associated regulatory factor n=1 Tax=Crucibulum laeve TaxID=68775 RepID=A0A5C3M984_9AGAR|nr:hypothetical protein BDQ12DRAFT_680895 [Crucibulum laeve]
MSRVELAKIPSLTFYADSVTTARRTSALPQLVCHGAPCKLFQPEVVRCVNLGGGVGTDVDWKCEADLPESLRFGKVEVSCEGYSKPGDPYVLKGSCSLDYRLVQIPGSLRDGKTDSPIFKSYDLSTMLFSLLWFAFLAVIIYSFITSCLRGNNNTRNPRTTSGPGAHPGGGSSGGWFPGSYDDPSSPPPPYSKTPTQQSNEGWRPGFMTGAVLGGLANHFWNGRRQNDPRPPATGTTWDWERDRTAPRASLFNSRPSRSSAFDDNRGEGSSNLGVMRRSTGLGGSNVR